MIHSNHQQSVRILQYSRHPVRVITPTPIGLVIMRSWGAGGKERPFWSWMSVNQSKLSPMKSSLLIDENSLLLWVWRITELCYVCVEGCLDISIHKLSMYLLWSVRFSTILLRYSYKWFFFCSRYFVASKTTILKIWLYWTSSIKNSVPYWSEKLSISWQRWCRCIFWPDRDERTFIE
jgi:hypothetical protein